MGQQYIARRLLQFVLIDGPQLRVSNLEPWSVQRAAMAAYLLSSNSELSIFNQLPIYISSFTVLKRFSTILPAAFSSANTSVEIDLHEQRKQQLV